MKACVVKYSYFETSGEMVQYHLKQEVFFRHGDLKHLLSLR
jgi:hypothetical protein